jgi:hypothetical protein
MGRLDLSINPHADIELRSIGDHDTCVVVDDFLMHPESVIEYAVENAATFETPLNSYPGMVRDLRDDALIDVNRFVKSKMSKKFSFLRGGLDFMTLLSMTTFMPQQLSNLQRLCHSDPRTLNDRANFAGLLYLFKDETLGGTGFYRWKDRPTMEKATALEMDNSAAALVFLKENYATFRDEPSYITESNEIAELIEVIPARFNRWIFYSGDIPHSAYITAPEKLSSDFAHGRLTLNLFASVITK